eukprot:6181102-Pleurochrysis_carterae.AAC.1
MCGTRPKASCNQCPVCQMTCMPMLMCWVWSSGIGGDRPVSPNRAYVYISISYASGTVYRPCFRNRPDLNNHPRSPVQFHQHSQP